MWIFNGKPDFHSRELTVARDATETVARMYIRDQLWAAIDISELERGIKKYRLDVKWGQLLRYGKEYGFETDIAE